MFYKYSESGWNQHILSLTTAAKERLDKQHATIDKKEEEQQQQATGKNYQQLPTETDVKEELREG